MKVFFRLLGLVGAVAGALSAQPVASAVLNNASYTLPGLSNSGIAQGSLFAVFGTGLATGNATATSFPLSASMNGTSVRVTAGTTSVDALMIYTTANQIGAMLPSNTPLGAASLVVTVNGQASRAVNFTVVKSAFGIFTANQAGSGPGSIQIVNSSTDQPTVGLNRPVRPGQTMIVWGTGLGPTTANEAAGPVPGDLPGVDVKVYVGGKQATVTYKGRSGCCASIDQIAFVVPTGVEGCYVPVVVQTGDVVSNFATIAVAASGNTCTDPTGITGVDIQAAQNSGASRIGSIILSRTDTDINISGISAKNRADIGTGSFYSYNLNQLLTAQRTSGGSNFSVSLGACSVVAFKSSSTSVPEFTDPVLPTTLDAGSAITITGPKGTKTLTKKDGGYFAELGGGTTISGLPGGLPSIPGLPASQPDYLEPGSYTLNNGSGGTNVGAFNVNFTMPALLNWTNQSSISNIARASNLDITWTGGDPNGYVQMLGISNSTDVAAMFICLERASAQRFSVPSYVLQSLPATTGNGANIGLLSVGGVTAYTRFTASGLDSGYIGAVSATSKTVNFR